MSKKNKTDNKGFVYSTDPNFQFDYESNDVETLPPVQQLIRIQLDTKHRAGKAVTLITGFVGKTLDLEELGKKIKSYCGTGGSTKDGEIIIQGDQREKVKQWFIKNGYSKAKRIG
jgi:translation initiation factor 1